MPKVQKVGSSMSDRLSQAAPRPCLSVGDAGNNYKKYFKKIILSICLDKENISVHFIPHKKCKCVVFIFSWIQFVLMW